MSYIPTSISACTQDECCVVGMDWELLRLRGNVPTPHVRPIFNEYELTHPKCPPRDEADHGLCTVVDGFRWSPETERVANHRDGELTAVFVANFQRGLREEINV